MPKKNIKIFFITLSFIQLIGFQCLAHKNDFFDQAIVHEIRINFYVEHYWDSLIYSKSNFEKTETYQYVPCNVNVDGNLFYYCGLRLKGNSSYSDYKGKKKSFKIKFDEFVACQDMNGISELNLNNSHRDPTFLREKLYYDFLRDNNVIAPKCTFTKLYINDVYWGVYLLVEEVDKKFIKNNFTSANGNLYKGDPLSTLCWKGEDQEAYYKSYKKITNLNANNWTDLVQLTNILDHSIHSDEIYFHSLDSIIDLRVMLNVFAANTILVNTDSYNYGAPHNFFLYFDLDSKKMKWIAWDANYSFDAFSPVFSYSDAVNVSFFYNNTQKANSSILYNLYNNKYIRKMYLDAINEMTQNFNSTYFNTKIDSLSDLIREDVYADTLKMYSNEYFERNLTETIGDIADPGAYVPGLKTFFVDRRKSVLLQLKKEGYK